MFLNVLGGWPFENPYEHFTLTGFSVMMLAVIFIFVISWFLRKGSLFMPNLKDQFLDNYIFDFRKESENQDYRLTEKGVSIKTKVVLCFFSLVIVFVPLFVFVRTLEPGNYYWFNFWFY
ncbi:hypothetical protein [Hanstruepera flava]|uniref:hypothetical protein n=1 Tax=Hanstruepera flava TaxID=2930218 RepID=UPI002027B919|nr:hypothetical protein [Hanstruepera flava]